MRRTGEESFEERARLDARIAFAVATFGSAYGLVALLDRVGAPERLVALLSPYFTVVALAGLGVSAAFDARLLLLRRLARGRRPLMPGWRRRR